MSKKSIVRLPAFTAEFSGEEHEKAAQYYHDLVMNSGFITSQKYKKVKYDISVSTKTN